MLGLWLGHTVVLLNIARNRPAKGIRLSVINRGSTRCRILRRCHRMIHHSSGDIAVGATQKAKVKLEQ